MFGLFDKANLTIKVPDQLMMEEAFECVVLVEPKSDANLRKIEIELYCQETACSRGTTDTYSHKKVFKDERVPRKDFKLKKGQALEFREKFRLPELSTPTIRCSNHWVEWFVRVRLDVPLWPDTRGEAGFTVLPMLKVPEIAGGRNQNG